MGVIAVGFVEGVVVDTLPLLLGAPEDLTDETGEVFSKAEKGFDMSRALVNGF